MSDSFPQIKRDLIAKVQRIEKYMLDGELQRKELQELLKEISKKLNGDYLIYPPVVGLDQRVIDLENSEKARINGKKELIKLAVGSLTIAIGGAVIWVFNVIKDAFTRGGH